MARLLVVHHTPSPALHSMLLAVRDGAADPLLADVEVVTRPALTAGAADVLTADAVIVGGPVNLGYLAGALKHFFDQIYYPCLDATAGRPYGVLVHGNNDTTGALLSIEKVVTGLGWRRAAAPLELIGAPTPDDLAAAHELGATLAAGLTLDARP